MRVVWSPLALERVEDIAQYIAEDKPSAAVEWVEGIFDTVERLADFPESERVVPEVGDVALGKLYLEHIGLFTASESRLIF